MKKVVVAAANTRWFGAQPYLEPMAALPILAAVLDGYYEYDIIDCNGANYSEEQCLKAIEESTPDVVLITGISLYFHKHHEKVAELAKLAISGIPTIMGGVYATTCYEHIMQNKNVDYVMLGHAEERLCQFIDAVLDKRDLGQIDGIVYRNNDELVVNPVTSYIGDLNKMVSPNYSKIDLTPYLGRGYTAAKDGGGELPIFTSYGCPHNCIFCSTRLISGRKVAYREIEDIINEIRYLKQKYAITSIVFSDDNILADEERAKRLFLRMIEENFGLKFRLLTSAAWHLKEDIVDAMAAAGCYGLGLSIESGVDRVLHNIIRKPLKKEIVPGVIKLCQDRGIYVSANIVIGFPGETWNEIRETIAFGEKCNPDHLNIYIASIFPKTDLYKLANENNCLPEDFDFFSDDQFVTMLSKGNITTDEFTPTELEILRSYEWDRINFATEEKRKKFCQFRGISEAQLVDYRKQARRSRGLGFGLRKKMT